MFLLCFLQLSLNGSGAGAAVPSSAFFGTSLKKVSSRFNNSKLPSVSFKVVATKEGDEEKQTDKDKWRPTRTNGEVLLMMYLMTNKISPEGKVWSTPSSRLPWEMELTTLS